MSLSRQALDKLWDQFIRFVLLDNADGKLGPDEQNLVYFLSMYYGTWDEGEDVTALTRERAIELSGRWAEVEGGHEADRTAKELRGPMYRVRDKLEEAAG